MGDAAGDSARDEAEEARQLQVRDEHHHAEQQDERAVVDGSDGGVERQAADGDHEDGADDGGASAVEAQPGQVPESEDHVRQKKD